MKMHANARLSLKGRELLVDRVENAGWSLSAAAEAAGISDRTARRWIARYRTEGPGGLLDSSSAPRGRREPNRGAACRGDRCAQAVADDRRGDRRVPRDGALDRVRDPDPDRAGQAGPPRPGARATLRTSTTGRADPHRHQEARSYPGHGHAVTGNRAQHARRTRVGNDGRLLGTAGGSSFTSRSTTPPDWPTSRYSPTRKRSRRSGSFAALSLTSPATASPSSGCLLTTAAPTAQPCTRSPAARFRSAICAPGPTDPRPTAKPSA